MPELTKIKLINPNGRKGSASNRGKKKKRKATNFHKAKRLRIRLPKGSSPKFMLSGGNPGRSTMAKKKKSKKKRPGKNYRRSANGFFSKGKNSRRRKNPMFGFGKKRRRGHRKNPMLPVTSTEFLQVTAGALGGGYGARAIPENIPFLTKYNVGWKGYLLNLAIGFALSKVARWISGPKAEEGALVGTVLMTGGRIISDQFGKTVVSFGHIGLGYDPAFNFKRMGKYVSAASSPLSPLPVPSPYANSGPVPPLPVGSPPGTVAALPAAPGPATAKQAMTTPTTVAAASSMGAYGRGGRYGVSRFSM